VVNFEFGRQRPTNYIQICKNIADQYPFGTPHGVQKDGIQNSIDARKGKGPVEVSFELVQNKQGHFLTITDSNTTGLTGPIYDPQDYDVNLPGDAHWARFESFAFTKDDPEAIGARGQGKFIFLDTSKNYTMFYDTLRHDGIYRVGATRAQQVGCPILPSYDDVPWENAHAAQTLKSECGLDPLTTIGSRIIIVDPNDELAEELESGRFERAIQETWFRAIEKKDLKVAVCGTPVGLPDP